MKIVSSARNPRNWLVRPALLLALITQFVLVLTPLIEGRDGPDARPHVEREGIQLHHAHDEAYCSACAARHLLSSSEVLPPNELTFVSTERTLAREKAESYVAVAGSHTQSRAPPAQI